MDRADPRSLLRRLYFDLVGIPPGIAVIERFRGDSSPDAYAAIMDELLNSPRYGERWGRHWMDVVRYADTAGDNADYPIPEMHLYRDYIIDSMNADKPFDEFVREQLAGDLLAKAKVDERYAERIVATGFVALSRRYGTIQYQHPELIFEDSIEATGRAFLGLSLRCARCHDHKSDPVTMKDYYGLYGIFASTRYPFAGAEVFASLKTPRQNFVPLSATPEAKAKYEAFRKRTAKLQEDVAGVRGGPMGLKLAAAGDRINQLDGKLKQSGLPADERTKLLADLETAIQEKKALSDAIIKREEELRKALPRSDFPPDLPAAYGVTEGTPTDSPLQKGGQPTQLGDIVPRGLPKFLSHDVSMNIPADQSGRLQLADWITDPDSRAGALLARVICNRVWMHHFGRGIVATPNNFGLNGAKPTHPELLDFLARELIRNGWSLKSLHRLILTSRTYQLSSAASRKNESVDPDNQTLWRHARRRLDAEAIRDAIMHVSGSLNLTRPGAHPMPSMEKWDYTQHNPFQDVYPSDHRSVYLMTQRFRRHPYLGLFDQPDTNTSTGRRTGATVPQQSLYLMNNPWIDRQTEALASRIIRGSRQRQQRINDVYRRTFGRLPSGEENQLCQRLLDAVAKVIAKESTDSDFESWKALCKVLLISNEFLYLD